MVKNSKLQGIGLIPVNNNPSTAQLILPGMRHTSEPPFGTEGVQLSLPFKEADKRASLLCNECPYFSKVKKPYKENYNTRCMAESPRPGGAYRVIKLNVYENEKVQKPFWCPLIKESIDKNIGNAIKPIGLLPSSVGHKVDITEQRKKELWLAMPGVTSWDDIKVGYKYHLPPTLKRGRMDILVTNKYYESFGAEIIGTSNRVWLYKQDEEYKFLSEIP